MSRKNYEYNEIKSNGEKKVFTLNGCITTYKDGTLKNVHFDNLLKNEVLNINLVREIIVRPKTNNTLSSEIKKGIEVELIKKFFFSLNKLKNELTKYLLDYNDLYLHKDFIYFDEEFMFIYLPDYKTDICKQLKEIFSIILDKIDYTNRELTTLSFAIFQMLESGKSLDDLIKFVNDFDYISPLEKAKDTTNIYDYESVYDELSDIDSQEFPEMEGVHEEVERKNIDIKYVAFGILTFILTIAVIACFYFNLGDEAVGVSIIVYVIIIFIAYKLSEYIKLRGKKSDKSEINITNEACDFKTSECTEIIKNNNTILLVGKNQKIVVDRFPFIVGSGDETDYLLSRRYVSKKHLKIFENKGELFIEDLHSTNGTYLNGRRLDKVAKIKTGDSLKIAKYMFTVM